MIRKERKVRAKRGRESHSGHKRKGSGNRGGRGRAGMGKKSAAHKKTQRLAMGIVRLGKHGFTLHTSANIKSINLVDLMKRVKGGEVNAVELGYDKVLGRGNALKDVTVKAHSFSAKAKDKIEKAKGKAVVM